MNATQDADILIIGGGTAGAVLASRLSEDPTRRVLLVEAGRDTPPGATPADIDDAFPTSTLNPGYFWPGLTATLVEGGTPRPYPQARVMGGGSSIMGMIALRGLPSDYDQWAAAGAEGLAWTDVLPYFRRLQDQRGGAAAQAHEAPPGPYAIRTAAREEWPGYVCAMQEAAARRGFGLLDDPNESSGDGFFAMPVARHGDTRSTSARCYLTDAVRSRPNLNLMSETSVTRLSFEGRRVVGASARRAGQDVALRAPRVVVSAGAIHSPAVLMRSGIGPADALRRLGIEIVADRPGVGRRLQNHCYSFHALTLPRGERMPGHLRRFAVAGLRASSGVPDCTAGDLFLFMLGRVSPHGFGTDVSMVASAVYTPYSRGQVTLRSADPHEEPKVDFRMLSDPRDAPRMLKSIRLSESLLLDPSVSGRYSEAVLLASAMSLAQFNRPGWQGKVFSVGAKAVLNGPGAMRRAGLGVAMPGALPLHGVAGARAVPDDVALSTIAPMGHPTGTCAMGRASDPMAVVDPGYSVIGVEGLSVVDASIMPNIPTANTNLPTLMVGEHASDKLRRALAKAQASSA